MVTQLSVDKLRVAIQKVLTEESYSKNAWKIPQAIIQAGGVKRAADIITQSIPSKKTTISSLKSGSSTRY